MLSQGGAITSTALVLSSKACSRPIPRALDNTQHMKVEELKVTVKLLGNV